LIIPAVALETARKVDLRKSQNLPNTLANAPEPPPINFPREKRKIVIPSGNPNVERLIK
jgi:hypothetical protein